MSDVALRLKVPPLYVPGNHDEGYREEAPEGGESIDGRRIRWKGLHIIGLGGSRWYNGGPDQYTEEQMAARVLRLTQAIRRAGRLDLVVTHAPPQFTVESQARPPALPGSPTTYPQRTGEHRGPSDHVHQGFQAFTDLIRAHHPGFLLHGHTHLSFGRAKRVVEIDRTRVIDVCGHYVLRLQPAVDWMAKRR